MYNLPAKAKILMVDDDAFNIKALNLVLSEEYHVLFAASGQSALEIAARTQPDLILLDIQMPGMDGFEVCRALKADPLLCDIPVIFLTAMTEETDEAIGLGLGAVDYLNKPIKPALVKLRVRNHLELKSQRDRLSRLTLIDGLTELANRRAFDERLEQEWRRALRTEVLLALIMIDIDFFKGYNDAYGHLAGDDCLRYVAQTLAASLKRAGDFVARYGGEEFIAILPGLNVKGMRAMAETMRESVAKLRIPHRSSTIAPYVTISIGAVSLMPAAGALSRSLVAACDQQLYLAKSHGRNRVSIESAALAP